MAYSLTQAAKLAATKIQKTPNLILSIDGYDQLFTFVQDYKILRLDDGYFIDDGLFLDTRSPNNKTKTYLSLNGTTKRLTQQLNQDGGTGSVSTMNISIVDVGGEITNIFSTNELLGVKASVYLSFSELEHPLDSVRIFNGIIGDYQTLAGEFVLTIENPDTLKRQELFIQYSSELTSDILDTDTLLPVLSNAGLLGTKGPCETHVRIDDEIMRVSFIGGTSTQIATVVRGALGTTATAHTTGTEVTSVYRLYGNPIDLALYIMLSGQELTPYYTTDILNFVNGPDGDINNAIFINDYDVSDNRGVVKGSAVIITGIGAKDGEYVVTDFGITSSATSYIVTDGLFEPGDFASGATISFQTTLNKLPDGCKMTPEQVDIEQHERIKSLFGAQFPSLEFLLEDTINAKEFIEKQLYNIVGAFYLPRKGRASIGYSAPAIAEERTPILNIENIENPQNIRVRRTINKNFYNAVVYKYGKDIIKNKYLNRTITKSEDSFNRIYVGYKVLNIESDGLVGSLDIQNFINTISLRILDRYKFGATTLTVETSYGVGYTVEAGDTVILDGSGLSIFDQTTGSRNTFERIMEVTNKTIDVVSGKVTLELTDTAFLLSNRYGTISPSSYIGSDSTTTRIKLSKGQWTSVLDFESEKWERYIGQPIQIRNDNFTFQELSVIRGIDPYDKNYILIDAITTPPTIGFVVELPPYDQQGELSKKLHASHNASVSVVSGLSSTVFDVGASDIVKFFVGSSIMLHNDDYSESSANVTVIDITSNTIIVSSPLGFIPSNLHTIERVGFVSDNGNPYTYF